MAKSGSTNDILFSHHWDQQIFDVLVGYKFKEIASSKRLALE